MNIIAQDRTTMGVRFYSVEGNLYVDIRDLGEHHSTLRKIARDYIKSVDSSYEILAYVGPSHYRRGDTGMPSTDRRFSVIKF